MVRDYNHHETDEQRQKAINTSKLKYSKKPWTCDKCQVTIHIGNKYRHLHGKMHNKN